MPGGLLTGSAAAFPCQRSLGTCPSRSSPWVLIYPGVRKGATKKSSLRWRGEQPMPGALRATPGRPGKHWRRATRGGRAEGEGSCEQLRSAPTSRPNDPRRCPRKSPSRLCARGPSDPSGFPFDLWKFKVLLWLGLASPPGAIRL